MAGSRVGNPGAGRNGGDGGRIWLKRRNGARRGAGSTAEEGRGAGAAGGPTGGGTGFFRRSLAQHRGTRPEERGAFRRRIYQTMEAVVSAQGKTTVERMSELARVSRAGFYRDWQQREPSQAEMAIRSAVQEAALRQRRYGYRRVTATLRRAGMMVGEHVVRRIMWTDNLLAIRKRKFVATSDSRHTYTVYPNLAQYVRVSAVDQLWVADITYLRLGKEFVYLAVVLDVYSRRVVGWSLGRSLHAELPLTALRKALAGRLPGRGLVHHSDRGSQYASDDYVKVLESAGMVISMSRPARPWENAYASHCTSLVRARTTCVTGSRLAYRTP